MPESDQDYDKESVNLWIDPEQKTRWKQYLDEESEFQYLSRLIRQTVEHEIQQDQTNSSSLELSENVTQNFDDLRSSIDHLEQVMQEVEKRLSGLEREVSADMHIVAPTDDEDKVWEEMNRPTFKKVLDQSEYSTLQYLSFEEVRETHDTVNRAGLIQQVF